MKASIWQRLHPHPRIISQTNPRDKFPTQMDMTRRYRHYSLFISNGFLWKCHPERRLLRFYRKRRSRRTCGLLVPPILSSYLPATRPSSPLSYLSILPNTMLERPCSFECLGYSLIRQVSLLPRQTTHFIYVTVAIIFLLPFSAQKSLVKPQNDLTPTNHKRSKWHFSYPQLDIINL